MAPLIFARPAFGVKKIGDGRTAECDGPTQDFLQRATQRSHLFPSQLGPQMRRMNFRPPQAFVGVNVTHAAEHALVQKQRLDARVPPADSFQKFLFADLQRVGAKASQFLLERHSR